MRKLNFTTTCLNWKITNLNGKIIFGTILCQKLFFGIRTSTQVKKFTTITKGPTDWTALHPVLSCQTTFYMSKVDHLLVPKFFHEKEN